MNSIKILATLLLAFLISTPSLASAQRFIRAPIYSGGNPVQDVATGDFNSDGNPDLAFVSNASPAVITIHLGMGDGKFNQGQQITLSSVAIRIIAGDWNNDGVLDLAAALFSNGSNSAAILLGNGDGTFIFQQSYDIGTSGGLTSGDVNGDGIADLVSGVDVLLGLGNGKSGQPIPYDVAFGPLGSVVLTDVNRDGKQDIVGVSGDSFSGLSMLNVLLGNADGTFGTDTLYQTARNGFNLVTSDFNQDGVPDVAVSGEVVSVYLGRGDGAFQSQVTYASSPYGGAPTAMAGADLNKDGKIDLLTLDYFENVAAVLLGNANGTFKGPSLFGTGPCPKASAVADFNKDGNLDAAVAGTCDSNFVELIGDGTGKFTTRRDFSGGNIASYTSVAAGYLDADKNLDLAVLASSNLLLFPGNKNGAFRLGSTYSIQGKGSSWVAIADLNADGKNDVVTADSSSNTVSVFLGNGNGTLQTPDTYATGKGPAFVTAVDVNGDGKLDLLTANTTANSFSLLLASGSGYSAHMDYTVAFSRQLAFGDFNRDGELDLISAGKDGSAQVFLGKGDGTFSAAVTLNVGPTSASVAVGDLNNDGKLDLALTNNKSALIYT
ncbi:MAG: VCBS repeat-containing protein, partial [Acidobacteriales bacterium]|nr:VCBS repeat-containing protein [Terriglobales bacterium]